MKNIKDEFIDYYSNNYNNSNDPNLYNNDSSIGGSLSKEFVRLDSSMLKNFLSASVKKDSAYVSYLDDFIKENFNKENKSIPLKYVSVLLKSQRYYYSLEPNFKEVIGSRIANALKVPTVYNEIIKRNGSAYTLSVDFVKPNQTIERLKDGKVECDISDLSTYNEWENFIDKVLDEKITVKKDRKEQMINQFKSDFVYQYLLKNLILDDIDFDAKNVLFIKEKIGYNKYQYKLAPANDYEFIFAFRKEGAMCEAVQQNLDYLFENYPDELNTFAQNLELAFYKDGEINKDKIYRLMKGVVSDEHVIKPMFTQCVDNIERFHIMHNFTYKKRKMLEVDPYNIFND